jgi:hypothetical protein
MFGLIIKLASIDTCPKLSESMRTEYILSVYLIYTIGAGRSGFR